MIFPDLAATVGNTPMVELARMTAGLPGRVLAKLEMRNPCGSVKDRVAVALIEDAERRGVLRPGMTLIEATGGNTGIGLAFAAAIRQYRLILTMPETMSAERVALLRHLGAEIVLTPGILMTDAVARYRSGSARARLTTAPNTAVKTASASHLRRRHTSSAGSTSREERSV